MQPHSHKPTWNFLDRKYFYFNVTGQQDWHVSVPFGLSLSFTLLASSWLLPLITRFLFSVFWPPLPLPSVLHSDLQTHDNPALSSNWKHKVIAALQCFTVNFFFFFFFCLAVPLGYTQKKKPHCLDTRRCTQLCLLLSLWKGPVCKPTRLCQDPFYMFTCPDVVGARKSHWEGHRLLWKSCVVVQRDRANYDTS